MKRFISMALALVLMIGAAGTGYATYKPISSESIVDGLDIVCTGLFVQLGVTGSIRQEQIDDIVQSIYDLVDIVRQEGGWVSEKMVTVLSSVNQEIRQFANIVNTSEVHRAIQYVKQELRIGQNVSAAMRNIRSLAAMSLDMEQQGYNASFNTKYIVSQLNDLVPTIKGSGKGVTIEVIEFIRDMEEKAAELSDSREIFAALENMKKEFGMSGKDDETTVVIPTSFSDVELDRWSYDNIMLCAQHGAIQGTTTPDANGVSTFDPAGTVTLGQFLAVLTRLLAKDHIQTIAVTGKDWSFPYYMAAINSGLIKSSDFSESKLTEKITRADMSYLIVKAAMLNGEELAIGTYTKYYIKDFAKVSSYRQQYVLQAYSNGLITGYDGGYFRPADSMTREQMAAVVCRLMGYVPRAEVDFETEPELLKSVCRYTDGTNMGMVTTDFQKEMAPILFNSVHCYKNANGEFCVKIDPITLPQELIDEGWKIYVGVSPDDDDIYSGALSSNGGFYLESGQGDERVLAKGNKITGYETTKMKDVVYVDVFVGLYHADYSDNSLRIKFGTGNAAQDSYCINYPNMTSMTEHGTRVSMDLTHIFRDLGLK